jgi:hypothetical protein
VAAALLCLLAAAVWLPGGVSAQVSQPVPFQAEAGPYHITLEQRLSGLSLGQAELVVTVLDRASRQPVTDARVTLLLQSPRSTEWARSLALGGPDAPGRYSARVNLDAPGVWQMAVEVSSPLGTVAVDTPPVPVPAMRRFTSGSWVFVGVTLTLVGGALYVWWSARRARSNAVGRAASSPEARK